MIDQSTCRWAVGCASCYFSRSTALPNHDHPCAWFLLVPVVRFVCFGVCICVCFCVSVCAGVYAVVGSCKFLSFYDVSFVHGVRCLVFVFVVIVIVKSSFLGLGCHLQLGLLLFDGAISYCGP